MIFFEEVKSKKSFRRRRMSKFEFRVTKYLAGGKVWTHNIIIRANEKLDARAKIEQIFPSPEYECEFVRTC